VTPKIFGIWSNISPKLLELETSNSVNGFIWRMTSRRTKISPKSGRGPGHVTPTIFGSTVGILATAWLLVLYCLGFCCCCWLLFCLVLSISVKWLIEKAGCSAPVKRWLGKLGRLSVSSRMLNLWTHFNLYSFSALRMWQTHSCWQCPLMSL